MIRGIILIRFLQEIGFTLPQIKEMHKQSAEEIKNLLTQNSKNIDERFFGKNSFSLVSLRNGNIQGFSAYYKISNSLCEIFLYISIFSAKYF